MHARRSEGRRTEEAAGPVVQVQLTRLPDVADNDIEPAVAVKVPRCGGVRVIRCAADVDSGQDPSFKIILPGNSTDSWLVKKIERRDIVGLRMPPSADPLSDVRIQNIKNWVDRGAKDN